MTGDGQCLAECLQAYDMNLSAKQELNRRVFRLTIQMMGTQKHYDFIKRIDRREVFGGFALTEISHG